MKYDSVNDKANEFVFEEPSFDFEKSHMVHQPSAEDNLKIERNDTNDGLAADLESQDELYSTKTISPRNNIKITDPTDVKQSKNSDLNIVD